jgi:hypothetical protein
MKRSFDLAFLADRAFNAFGMLVAMREKILFSFATNKGAFGTGFYFVDLEVVKALNVLYEFLVFLGLCRRAC